MRRSHRRLGVGTGRSPALATVTFVNGSASLVTSTLTTDVYGGRVARLGGVREPRACKDVDQEVVS